MKSITKKVLASTMAVGMAGVISVTSAFASDVTFGDNFIYNDYLKIIHDTSSSCFFIDAMSGNPDIDTDDKAILLYHTTSNVYTEVDGVCNRFNCSSYSVDSEGMTATAVYDDVNFTRTLKFIPNKINGREDVVEVKCTATNNSDTEHQVGARIMLDTMLGENDDAPFRISGIGAVTTRTQLEGDSIPTSYQAFDSLDNPTVVSTGSFASGLGKPDIVQYNNYWEAKLSVLIPECNETLGIGDSTVSAIWKPVTLAPGESKNYVAYYGIGEVLVNGDSELILGASRNESAFEINEDGTAYNPVSITGYVKNAGNDILNNVELSIDLPNGVTLENGENAVIYDTMNVNAENQNTWVLNAAPSAVERTVTITIKAKSDEITNVEPVVYTYTIPALNIPTEPETEPETVPATEPETVPVTEPETEPSTVKPTEAPTQKATQASTQTATNPSSTSAPTQGSTNANNTTQAPVNSTTETGKVATGDSAAILMLFAALLTVSGVTVFVSRRRSAK